jgi:hypothetical protein
MSSRQPRRACGRAIAGAIGITAAAVVPVFSFASNEAVAGRDLAARHCATCHLMPEPASAPRQAWREQILPRMKWRLGFTTPQIELSKDIDLLRRAGRIPLEPVISEKEWQAIAAWYFTNAPEAAPSSPPIPISIGLKSFQTVIPEWRSPDPSVTWIGIDPEQRRIRVAEDRTRTLKTLDADGQVLSSVALSNVIVSVRPAAEGLLATAIGSFLPTDEVRASVLRLQASDGAVEGPPLLTRLPRATDALEADLNGDGHPELVVCAFGNNLGRFSWFETRSDGACREHVLFPQPGALRCDVADFNDDGRPDLAVLVAQETEALFLFINKGAGEFRLHPVFQRPPHYGHSHFQTIDFDRDGRLDFLVANGDNGEFESPPKNCHGLRLYLNLGGLRFEEVFFFPMNGAYHAIAHDFDQDGDLDIAAVSFFPDYRHRPEEGFVYLENQGALRFKPATFRESLSGRWLTMAAGDVEGDGDADLVLGAYMRGPRDVPDPLMQGWAQARLPVILLRNSTR